MNINLTTYQAPEGVGAVDYSPLSPGVYTCTIDHIELENKVSQAGENYERCAIKFVDVQSNKHIYENLIIAHSNPNKQKGAQIGTHNLVQLAMNVIENNQGVVLTDAAGNMSNQTIGNAQGRVVNVRVDIEEYIGKDGQSKSRNVVKSFYPTTKQVAAPVQPAVSPVAVPHLQPQVAPNTPVKPVVEPVNFDDDIPF